MLFCMLGFMFISLFLTEHLFFWVGFSTLFALYTVNSTTCNTFRSISLLFPTSCGGTEDGLQFYLLVYLCIISAVQLTKNLSQCFYGGEISIKNINHSYTPICRDSVRFPEGLQLEHRYPEKFKDFIYKPFLSSQQIQNCILQLKSVYIFCRLLLVKVIIFGRDSDAAFIELN